jgi:hypothetical protein
MDYEFFRDFGLKVMALFELIKNNRFKFSYIHTLKREDYQEKIKIMGQKNLKSCPLKKNLVPYHLLKREETTLCRYYQLP